MLGGCSASSSFSPPCLRSGGVIRVRAEEITEDSCPEACLGELARSRRRTTEREREREFDLFSLIGS